MRTQKQIEASRANGSKSHGAVTPEGKARIVHANLWTGVFAEDLTLSWEFREDLDELCEEYYTCHPPHSPEARCLVDQLILCEWQLRRLHHAEALLWHDLEHEAEQEGTGPLGYPIRAGDPRFSRIQSRINATRRAFHKALAELERLEARDAEVVVVEKNPDGIITYASASTNPKAQSLPQNPPANPAPEAPPPSAPTPSNASTSPTLGSLRQNAEPLPPAAKRSPTIASAPSAHSGVDFENESQWNEPF